MARLSSRQSLAALGLAALLGCNPKAAAVETRAANDLRCPRDQIEVRSVGGSAYVATGCDQSVTYVCQRENPRENYEKDTSLPELLFLGDSEPVACKREGEVQSTGFDSLLVTPDEPPPPAQADCPAGSHREGGRCVGDVAVTCPAGHRFELNVGCVPGEAAPAGATAAPAVPAKHCPEAMVYVPGGGLEGEGGQLTQVAELCIDVTEVTARAYGRCSIQKACSSQGLTSCGGAATFVGTDRQDHPINCVSWAMAAVYCKWAHKRLPTDAEWQWAARGAGKTTFPWGDAAPGDRPCWSGTSARSATCPAGTPPGDKSPQGVLGLTGNVAEWTATAGDSKSKRAARGGSFGSRDAAALLVAATLDTKTRAPGVGFRCVASPK